MDIDSRMKIEGLTEAKEIAGKYRRVTTEIDCLPSVLSQAVLVDMTKSTLLPDAVHRLRALKSKGATESIATLRQVVADAVSSPATAQVGYWQPDSKAASSMDIDYQPSMLLTAVEGLRNCLEELDGLQLEYQGQVPPHLFPLTGQAKFQKFEPSPSGRWVAVDPDKEALTGILNTLTSSLMLTSSYANQSALAGGLFNESGTFNAGSGLALAAKQWVGIPKTGSVKTPSPAPSQSSVKAKQGYRKEQDTLISLRQTMYEMSRRGDDNPTKSAVAEAMDRKSATFLSESPFKEAFKVTRNALRKS